MFAKLLAVVLCLTGAFPQRACRCAPEGLVCAASAGHDTPRRCPACSLLEECDGPAHVGHQNRPAPSPQHHPDCPCTRAAPGVEATLASLVVAPAPETDAVLTAFEPAVRSACRALPVGSTTDPPPHVPLFLELQVLRN